MTCIEDTNIAKNKFKKVSNYKDLQIEVTKMQKFKTKIIPLVI